jgi:hypothetical protein
MSRTKSSASKSASIREAERHQQQGGPVMSRTNWSASKYLAIDDARVAEILAGLVSTRTLLAPFLIDVTAEQRRSIARARPGSPKAVAVIGDLAAREGIRARNSPIEEMTASMTLAGALQQVLPPLQSLCASLSDTILALEGRAWSSSSLYYSVLKRMAKTDPQLFAELGVAREVFGRRSATAKKALSTRRADGVIRDSNRRIAQAEARKAANAGNSNGRSGAKSNGAETNN